TKRPGKFRDAEAGKGAGAKNKPCIYCKGAPEKDPVDMARGLTPEPPFLPDTIEFWSTAEVFWIIKNGVKMTGMPSFGASHKDDEIWKLVAFVQKLPKMKPEEYDQMTQAPQQPAPAPAASPPAEQPKQQ